MLDTQIDIEVLLQKVYDLGEDHGKEMTRMELRYEAPMTQMRMTVATLRLELEEANRQIAVFKAMYEPEAPIEISPEVEAAVEEIAPGLPLEPVLKTDADYNKEWTAK